MPVQDELYQAFLAASGQQTPDFAPITYALSQLIAQVDQAQRIAVSQQTAAQTAAKQSKAQAQSQSSTTSVFQKVLQSGFGVSPIVSGLIDLFSGSDTPAPLQKFGLPPSIAFQGAETSAGLTTADYDQSGMARAYPQTANYYSGGVDQTYPQTADYNQGGMAPGYPQMADYNQGGMAPGYPQMADYNQGRTAPGYPQMADYNQGGTASANPQPAAPIQSARGSSAPQITVNVQAMDARSFLDRSGDIALAVREAMLNLNSINDVVNDL